MSETIDTNNALVTLAELKEYLAYSGEDSFISDESNDDQLTLLINAAALYCNSFTGVELLQREQTEYYNGDGGDYLYVNNYPITESPAIDLRIDPDRDFEETDRVEADDMAIEYEIGKITLLEDVFPSGAKTIKIVYTAGYAAGSVPSDLRLANCLIIERMWKNQKDKLASISSLTTAGNSISLIEKEIPEMASTILKRYSRAVL